jgi:dipeptidyl aminopeptidase/acylaminoacyl peptidase
MIEYTKKLQDKPPSGGIQAFYQITDWNESALAKLRESSPATYLGRNTPPFLFIHGTRDEAVPYEQSLLAVELFKKAGIPCELITVQDGVHGVIHWEKEARFQGYKAEMIDWLHKRLGRPPE